MKKSEFFISANSSRVFTFFLFFLFCAGRLTAATWYVKPSGSDANAGNSWAAAYQTLTKALQSAASGDQIWVATGTYKPTTGTDRTISFSMKNGVAILGGFPATGNPVLADRDWETHVTTLSGDIGTAGDNSDNSYNIIANVNNGLTASAILDGFTVTGGNANGGAFVNWFGGGMYLGSSSPTIRNCTFSNNNALYGGGGVAAFESSATISACVFNGNYSAQDGGGLGLYGTTISVNNCVFTGNSAVNFGAAIYSGTSNNTTLTNCSFSGNSGYPIILNAESTFNLKNGIIWENTGDVIYNFNGTINVSNSIVQGGYAGNGNLNVDPLFVDQANGDLRLQTCSPAINKGNNAAVPAGVTTDLDGNNRFFGTVDMGAYEYQGTPPVLAVCKNITVQLDATGNVTVPASAVDNGSTVACGIAILTLSKTNFNCSNVGNPLVSLEVKDNDGNKAYCSTTITVQDNIAPTALCKNATVQLDATGNVTVPGSAVDNGSSDVCGIAALTLSKTNFNCSNVGSHLVSLEVRDNNGNKAYCSTTLTVQDNIAPTAVCQNTTLQLDASGNATLAPAAINNGSADACGIASLALSKTAFDCSNIGANAVTLTATDNNGRTATCSASVTVQDNVAPTAICQNATVQLDATGNVTVPALAVNNGSADACGIASLSLSKTTFNCSNIGANTVTLTVTDNNGKTASCTATVTVQDNVAPTAICQNATVQLDATGNATLAAAAVNNGSADACGIASLALSKTTFNCSNIGANTVTLTVTDNNGKTATCSATVTIQDNIDPTVTCPEDITVTPDQNNPCSAFVESGLDAIVNDNCTVSLAYHFSGALMGGETSQVPATTFPNGVTTITYTATDGGQNSAQCAFQVTVGSCGIGVSGKLIWENDDASGVGNAVVSLSGDETASMTTPADGLFSFSVEASSDLTINPAKTINKLNGVTTADATRIQQHVANSNPLTDLYKLVAADVNKSNSVTTQDASIINQALLGNPAALVQFKTSWRFVPTSHTMNNPPWGFPEKITLNDVQGSMSEQNFYGIKTGDVLTPFTNPANFNGSVPSEFVFNAPDQLLQFGEQVTVTFSANQFSDLAALQFALKFDVEKLALLKIEPLMGLPVSEENFGTYNVSEGKINVAWSQAEGVFVEEAAPIFKLTFNVLETGGTLSEALQLAEHVLEGHAYTSTLTDNDVKLNFFSTTSSNAPIAQPPIELLQNRPNPFVSRTTIDFALPESCEAQLRVFDASGRVLFSQKKNYAAGRHEETLNLDGANGVLWYELVTPFGILAKKMVATQK